VRAWQVVRHGAPSSALELREVDDPVAGPREVVVRAAASALNYNEIDGCRGRYLTVNPPMPYTLGMEVVGVVESTGPGAEHWRGRRVVATATGAFGAHAELVSAPMDMVFDAPTALDDEHAAAFLFPFHLAWLGLFTRGRLTAGQSVLVHAAAGGVGSAAVQLAVAHGVRVLAVAGGAVKVERCRAWGADVVIDHTVDDFVAVVAEETAGRGVDLVFDGVGAEIALRSLQCVAFGGTYMTVGFAGGIEAEEVAWVTPRQLCFGNLSVAGVMLSYTSFPDAARAASGFNIVPRAVGERIHADLCELLDAGRIAPVVSEVVPFAELPMALEAMEERRTTGRVIVTRR